MRAIAVSIRKAVSVRQRRLSISACARAAGKRVCWSIWTHRRTDRLSSVFIVRGPGNGPCLLHGEEMTAYTVTARDCLDVVPAREPASPRCRSAGWGAAVPACWRMRSNEIRRTSIFSSLIAHLHQHAGCKCGIVASSDALIPVAGDYLSLTGLARLMLTLQRLQPLVSATTPQSWLSQPFRCAAAAQRSLESSCSTFGKSVELVDQQGPLRWPNARVSARPF